MVIWVQRLGVSAPKIWESKKRPKLVAILDNFRLCARISPERIEISKLGKSSDQLQPLPRWAKKTIHFGPLTKKL